MRSHPEDYNRAASCAAALTEHRPPNSRSHASANAQYRRVQVVELRFGRKRPPAIPFAIIGYSRSISRAEIDRCAISQASQRGRAKEGEPIAWARSLSEIEWSPDRIRYPSQIFATFSSS